MVKQVQVIAIALWRYLPLPHGTVESMLACVESRQPMMLQDIMLELEDGSVPRVKTIKFASGTSLEVFQVKKMK